ncbi:insulin receptor substrate-1, putative [Pediculus humanus corporis]|uniref:Insulin receptor substrate 1 n=1 Tax=Pediculus humanus subsp. corporis TaxID=121224 RepID=E0VU10_PEDHC|nr:insulin receptor substrate-1, putative [Pediculus humanus corporis]EEB16866.1 insulin receptor substrate-1, putative [Pediculus humanus corporis]
MKKKFFILRGESSDASARLEYYDSEKKWRNSQPPKRTISLKTCFNINRRKDTKHKYVIALYTKDDCFCIVLDSEEDLQEWLRVLLKLQTGEECVDGEQPKPNFEHVWKVTLQEKGLGDSKNLVGPYHVCLTDQTLTLVKITEDDAKPETLEFPLIYIRSCGVTGSFFYIEVGRQTVTGAGALWMLTEDANIAKNMNEVIFSAFSVQQKNQKDSNPHRKRSSSATESSKPTSILQRRQTHGPTKPIVSSGYSDKRTNKQTNKQTNYTFCYLFILFSYDDLPIYDSKRID